MNFLAKVKLTNANEYDLVVDNLYKTIIVEDEEVLEPITDVEGTKALLSTDGTSWEFVDDDWQQIEQSLDEYILASIYPFIMSICDSIHEHFVRCKLSKIYESAVLSYNVEDNEEINKNIIKISIDEEPLVQAGDFIYLKTCTNEYLTTVISTTENTIKIDNAGLDIRVTGKEEKIAVFFVSFPPQFLDTVLNMFGFDLFIREDKEKRQERLGNYTYTNFEPIQYYGEGSYPKNLEESIKYWQRVLL